MGESIKKLREIVQQKPTTNYTKQVAKEYLLIRIYRFFSIYFTKVAVMLKLSAANVTFVSMITVLIGGLFLTSPSPLMWIGGSLFFILFAILDCSDGEMARYNKSCGPIGRYYDLFAHGVESTSAFLGMSVGLFLLFKEPYILVMGTILVSAALLRSLSKEIMKYNILDYVVNTGDNEIKGKKKVWEESKGLRYSLRKFFLTFFCVPYLLIFVSVLDLLMRPIVVILFGVDIPINWRFLLFAAFFVVTPLSLVLEVRKTLRLDRKVKKHLLEVNR
jgi:phosphatidylglycerophosphate synthase